MITLVLGGNKSGKSDFALDLMAKSPAPGVFIATGKAKDMEFRKQIRKHQQSRGPELEVMEAGEDLPQLLKQAKLAFPSLLVDSLDYWLFSCREAGCETERVLELLDILDNWGDSDLIVVSCEAGLGPLPARSAVRAFIRSLGALNQGVAKAADQAFLVTAGLPLTLKQG